MLLTQLARYKLWHLSSVPLLGVNVCILASSYIKLKEDKSFVVAIAV